MRKIKLSNLNLYTNDNQLFIGYGDGYLSKIEGDDVEYIEVILSNLQSESNYISDKQLYASVDKIKTIERDYFDALIVWLKGNGIVLFEEKEKEKEHLSVSVLGLTNNEGINVISKINDNLLKDDEYELLYKEFSDNELFMNEIDFCLVFSPMLNKDVNSDIFTKLYSKNIPHIYIDYSSFSVTLGPAINPSLKMHSMHCFFKRRIANTSKPSIYLSLIKLDSKQIRHVSLEDSNVYNTLIEWLTNELIRLLYSNWESGSILGKTKTINFVTNEFTVTRILKTPDSVGNERKIFRPLNG
jgi:hypothetical protein